MRWFDRHIDRSLEAWAQGELSTARASRLLRHAHTCARCGLRYERWVRAQRALESGDPDLPSFPERAGLGSAGLEAALAAAAAPGPWRANWPLRWMFAGMVAVTCLLLVLIPSREPEWQVRGEDKAAPAAVLRIFCAAPGKTLRELSTGQTCPPGSRLAFAVGAEAPLSRVAVQLRGAGREALEGSIPITGRPGEEVPLEQTILLPETPGTVEVIATFSALPTAMPATQEPTEVVVRRQFVRVQEAP